MSRRDAKAPVYRITGAARGLTEDINYRQRRYILSMAIRTICFAIAVFVHGPLRFVMLVAAIALPYFAVVFANGGREPGAAMPDVLPPEPRKALDAPKKSHPS